MHISGWAVAATPAAADIFIQHSKVAALTVGDIGAGQQVDGVLSPAAEHQRAGRGWQIRGDDGARDDRAGPPTWLTQSFCVVALNEVRTVRPGSLSDIGAERQEAICCADRATDQTGTSYSSPTNPVAEPNPAPSWKVPASSPRGAMDSRSAVAAPSL